MLRLSNVKKTYGDFNLDVSLEVGKGQITGLIGTNGAGKSSTFKAILGLIQTEGEILFEGKDVHEMNSQEKQQIGVQLSESGFSGYFKIKDVMAVMDAMYDAFSPEEFKSRCEKFGLPLNKDIRQFSTGMKAKLKVLLALSYGAKLLILDEPTAGLDVIAREEIGAQLSESGFSGYFKIKDLLPIMKAMYTSFSPEAFQANCEQFNLPLNKEIREFSTGMKAKLKVLIALSHGAKLLVLDEPTAGLDVIAREEILDILRDYVEDGSRSILISSHISADLEGLCDDLYFIDEGRILMHEETDVLLSDYGLMKLTPEQFEKIDKEHVLRYRKESFGYTALTNQKAFYMENFPEVSMEKGSIDEFILMMVKGEK